MKKQLQINIAFLLFLPFVCLGQYMVQPGDYIRKINMPKATKGIINQPESDIRFTVKGVVTDESGEALIGATVLSKKTSSLGTVTEYDGSYTIDLIDAQDTLVFSYTGYTTTEEPLSGRSEINVILSANNQTLDEVIVVGFGTQQKRFVTSSVSKLGKEDLQNTPVNTIDNLLAGRAAGVQVTTSSGLAGASVNIRVRGVSSVNASSEPLYVVDGVPIVSGNFSSNNNANFNLSTASETNALTQLNPADIESIQVLKDASAAAIYGSRGANGVVLITTKKGKQGKTQVNFGYYSGISMETNRIEMLDGSTYLDLAKEAWSNSHADDLADNNPNNDNRYRIDDNFDKFYQTILPEGLSREKAEATNTDWLDLALQRGFIQEGNASVSGGNEKTLFYIGGTFRDEKGILVGNEFQRANFRINLDHKISKNISVGTRTAFTNTDNQRVPTSWAGGIGLAQRTALPFYPVFNDDGTFFSPQTQSNVAAELAGTDFNNKATSVLANVFASINLSPDLTIRTEWGLNNIYGKENYYRSEELLGDALATSILTENLNWNSNNTINFKKQVNIHSFDILGGLNLTKNTFTAQSTTGERFPNPALRNPQNAEIQTFANTLSEFSFVSFFGRFNYRLKDRYLFSATVRRDGSSRFGANSRWGTFPAFSLGWLVSEEGFLADNEWLTFLKLRGSWGMVGNAEIGNYRFLGTFASENYTENQGLVLDVLDNPNLGWETSQQYNAGLDFGIKEGRIEGGFEFYLKQTDDLLVNVKVSALTGTDEVTANAGSLENRGFEVYLTTHNLTKKLRWTTDITLGYNENKITNLGGVDFIPGSDIGATGAIGVGHPVGARYMAEWAGVAESDFNTTVTNPDSGQEEEILIRGGDEMFINQFGELTNIYDPRDQKFLGNANPTWTGGIGNKFQYGNFDLNVLFTFAAGQDLENAEQRFQFNPFGFRWTSPANLTNRWQNPGDQTDQPRLTWLDSEGRGFITDRYVYNASFLRLKDLTLGYNVPRNLLNKWGIGSMRFYFRGVNVLTFTPYEGWDPEFNRDDAGNRGQGKSWTALPQMKSFIGGVNLSF